MSMKGETQSVHLRQMMQRQQHLPEYSLVLPLFELKRKSLKRLERTDLLLLGSERLELYLQDGATLVAKVTVENSGESVKLSILSLEEIAVNTNDSKKYENILTSFGKVQCRTLEVGHKIELSQTELQDVTLFVGEVQQAKGLLVTVDDEIAVKITEVNNG